jgi:hypothetical protein
MFRRFTKKRVALVVAPLAALALAGGAYAYFSSTGTGTGSASVGKATAFTVAQTATKGGPLYPDSAGANGAVGNGANVVTDTYTVTNPSAGSQNLNQVVVSIATANGAAWSSGKCTASDFSVEGQPVGQSWADTRAAGDMTAGSSKSENVTVEMIDSAQNQDDCQGVTVPLYFSAS